MFRGKKYKDSAKQIDRSVQYEVSDALALVVKTAPAKFDETVEIHIKLGVDSRPAGPRRHRPAQRHRQDPQGPCLRQGRQGRRGQGSRR